MNNGKLKLAAPPMGWNSFDCYGCAAYEEILLQNMKVMSEKYLAFGYEYFVVDNGWFGNYEIAPGKKFTEEIHARDVNIDEFGRPIPAECNFPSGIKYLAGKAHELGLKFGIHLMRGIPRKAVAMNTPIPGTEYCAADIADIKDTCVWCHYMYGVDMTKPGAQEYYNSVINQLASWDIDFIKVDDVTGHPAEIEGIARAIKKCPRDIILSLSPGGQTAPDHMSAYRKADMLRVTKDIWDKREQLHTALEKWHVYEAGGSDGFFIDLDMIPFGHLQVWRKDSAGKAGNEGAALVGEGGYRICLLNDNQKYTFITMRALAASPLFIGGELITMDEFSDKLLTNSEMLECNQNCRTGRRVYFSDGIDIRAAKSRKDEDCGWIGVFNTTESVRTLTLTSDEIPVLKDGFYSLRDIWNELDLSIFKNSITADIPADGVLFLKYNKL